MDQIGPDDGADIDTSNILANQIFEAGFAQYDIAVIDDFEGTGLQGSSMALVVSGWNGYAGIAGISALQVNFYQTFEDAGVSLVGYVNDSVAGTPDADPNWGLAGYDLIGMTATSTPWAIGLGTQWAGMIPTNEFGTNGQTGVAISTVGDLVAYQCNPAGGFGFGPFQQVAYNAAFRVLGGTGNACDLPLPTECNADVSGPSGVPDGVVGVDDVLAIIGTYGEVGDGTSRPQGDCFPLPDGNCTVDVDDLLEAIGQYGNDCRPLGACCFGVDGCQENELESNCEALGGDWLGGGSACAACVSGACCLGDGSCIQATPEDCTGAYQGDSTDCGFVTCVPAPDNDTCDGAEVIGNGDTGIDVTYALTNGPADFDGTLCANFSVDQIFNDVWYSYTADCDGSLEISLCNQVDFDSRIAIYDACGGTMLACNDDADSGLCGLTSELVYAVAAGDSVIIRVGRYSEGGGTPSTGVMSVNCVIPSEGACCVGETCYDLLPDDCTAFGGSYEGAGTDCLGTQCGVTNNDCASAETVDCSGSALFDTSNAFDSGFGEPDATQCDGTYLDWGASPDVWFVTTPDIDGTMDISLCDAASYDTSLVLYEGSDCGSLVQVACNGDSTVESGCQSYYSGIYGHPVTSGNSYYIRIGGWNGATGPGNLTLTCLDSGATGACCVGGACVADDYTADQCATSGGTWYAGEACADVDCPDDVACTTGNGANTVLPDGAWIAGTADSGAGYFRAAWVSAPAVSSMSVTGLSLIYNAGWSACSDASTLPMGYNLMDGGYGSLNGGSGANYAPTNLSYAGVYPLSIWDFACNYDGSLGSVVYAGANSESNGTGECWFLWMSSTADGEGQSSLDDGTGWVEETFGLNYCITE
ncbi:MAG: hypothetical protein MK116_11490 [Phycisphaerales bacterium]|nr:hypothetical protein [Phycisphaerales bacterium]